ncbi:TIGR01777 family oxidoreductase [Acinetobacter sp. ANC 4862]|uniref:TIGR01777 family oxidoreductase n=1 Tax=Acinetobacter sp. ANC 4862 TaxID=2529849 RepID=UPI00103C7EA9|nr:TIGR01777 family oxidoreductase [Acinetobacter sp. ANC 4862]TCH61469.1 TIGR01777 family protein [Acinetobacter sp. ANC 4862]
MLKENVLVTGASGFIGSHLLPYLLSRDYAVIGLTRQKNKISNHPDLTWVQSLDELKTDRIDYVINLAGENIGQARWTATRKQQLIESRVDTTHQLYRYLEKRQISPKCIISGSAVGYYGIDPNEQWSEVCTEQSAPQSIFMSELCQLWEQAALSFQQQNTKIVRFGIVLAKNGGILPRMLLPIKLNMVGRIGHGRQPVVWVHIQDIMRAIEFLMLNETSTRIFNVVCPEKMTQGQFAQIAAQQLHRKPLFCLPAFVLKGMLGEQAQLVLNGQYVQPKALQELGFEFKYPTLKLALADILAGG